MNSNKNAVGAQQQPFVMCKVDAGARCLGLDCPAAANEPSYDDVVNALADLVLAPNCPAARAAALQVLNAVRSE